MKLQKLSILLLLLPFTLLYASDVKEYRSSKENEKTQSLENALKNGKFSANLKLFYMIRTFDHIRYTAKAFNGGGILKYESASYHRFRFGLAYYGSHKLGNIYSRRQGIGTSLLQLNGKDIEFLGEAYLQYEIAQTTLKAGRQQLDTPLLEGNDQRLVPTVFEAYIIKSEDLPDTHLEAGYVKSYSGFASYKSGFDPQDRFRWGWGKDGLGYIYIQNKSLKALSFKAQYIRALSTTTSNGQRIKRRDYQFASLKYDIPFGENSYLKAQYLANDYIDEPNSKAIGAKIATTVSAKVDIALVYDKIIDNNLETISSAPLYTDFQQGYGLYEPSTGFGTTLTYKPIQEMKLKFGYANVSTNRFDHIDDFAEYLIDLKYKINNFSKFRIRASLKDQSEISEELLHKGLGGREDRKDLRVIYYLKF